MRNGLMMMSQDAPYPLELQYVLQGMSYKRGWHFSLNVMDRGQFSKGLTLTILVETRDSYNDENWIRVSHLMPVPPAAYDMRSWRRWVFDQIMLVERHEAMEFFVVDGERPYAPSHGPGNDPYMLREVGTDVDQQTSFRGEVKDKT